MSTQRTLTFQDIRGWHFKLKAEAYNATSIICIGQKVKTQFKYNKNYHRKIQKNRNYTSNKNICLLWHHPHLHDAKEQKATKTYKK